MLFASVRSMDVECTGVSFPCSAVVGLGDRDKFAPVAKPGVFLGYRFEPGGKWKGDCYVADLEHFQAGVVRPSIHQVKQIYHDAEEPFVFPLLKAYEARTREIASYKHDRLSDPDHLSGKILPREDESFSFDEV